MLRVSRIRPGQGAEGVCSGWDAQRLGGSKDGCSRTGRGSIWLKPGVACGSEGGRLQGPACWPQGGAALCVAIPGPEAAGARLSGCPGPGPEVRGSDGNVRTDFGNTWSQKSTDQSLGADCGRRRIGAEGCLGNSSQNTQLRSLSPPFLFLIMKATLSGKDLCGTWEKKKTEMKKHHNTFAASAPALWPFCSLPRSPLCLAVPQPLPGCLLHPLGLTEASLITLSGAHPAAPSFLSSSFCFIFFRACTALGNQLADFPCLSALPRLGGKSHGSKDLIFSNI